MYDEDHNCIKRDGASASSHSRVPNLIYIYSTLHGHNLWIVNFAFTYSTCHNWALPLYLSSLYVVLRYTEHLFLWFNCRVRANLYIPQLIPFMSYQRQTVHVEIRRFSINYFFAVWLRESNPNQLCKKQTNQSTVLTIGLLSINLSLFLNVFLYDFSSTPGTPPSGYWVV